MTKTQKIVTAITITLILFGFALLIYYHVIGVD
jgi:hypothetical protein